MGNKLNDENEQTSGRGGGGASGFEQNKRSSSTGKLIIGVLAFIVLVLGGYVLYLQNQNKVKESETTLVDEVENVSDKSDITENKIVTDTIVVRDTVLIEREEDVSVQQVTVVPATVVMTVGEQFALQFVVIPKNATNRLVSWSSSMPDIVRVDAEGMLTALHSGNAVIRVTTGDGGHTADCLVFVEKGKIEMVSSNELKLPYGSYNGDIKNTKSHGMGTIYYNTRTQISPFDDKARMAEPGDCVSGEFYEGKLVQGKWFAKDGRQKGTLIIGRAR